MRRIKYVAIGVTVLAAVAAGYWYLTQKRHTKLVINDLATIHTLMIRERTREAIEELKKITKQQEQNFEAQLWLALLQQDDLHAVQISKYATNAKELNVIKFYYEKEPHKATQIIHELVQQYPDDAKLRLERASFFIYNYSAKKGIIVMYFLTCHRICKTSTSRLCTHFVVTRYTNVFGIQSQLYNEHHI